jgi:DinB superfamily
MDRPSIHEYAPHYQKYIDLVEEGNFFERLDENTTQLVDFFKNIDSAKQDYRYAEKKWTIKEVLVHIIDTERGFSFRAIVCTRHDDKIPLYGMDEDFYGDNVEVSDISMESLIEEFLAVRQSLKFIFLNNKVERFSFLGNGVGHPISARALGYLAIGHAKHHINIVKERYL